MVDAVQEKINFPKEEEKVLEFWKEINAFQTSLKQSKNKPRYILVSQTANLALLVNTIPSLFLPATL